VDKLSLLTNNHQGEWHNGLSLEVNSLHQCKIQWLNMESKLKHTESMINQSFKGKSTP